MADIGRRNGTGVRRPAAKAPAPAVRLHASIARDIGVEIAAGRLRPGDTLAGEIEAAGQLEVSRTAYREAIRILAAKGMVESRTKTGTRVSLRERWHILDPELLGWFLETKPTEAFVRDLFEVRIMVEPHAAALAALNHVAADIAVMERSFETMRRLGLGNEEGRAADRAFHRQILVATRNEMIAALSSSVCAAVSWTTSFKHRMQRTPRDPQPEHRLVLDAIKARDAGRARAEMVELCNWRCATCRPRWTGGRLGWASERRGAASEPGLPRPWTPSCRTNKPGVGVGGSGGKSAPAGDPP